MTKEATRLQILQTATRLFAEKGFADTSMNDIVAASGISKGGIYWHFKSKDEIIAAIYSQFFDAQVLFASQIVEQTGTVRERLLFLIDAIGQVLTNLEGGQLSPVEMYAQALRNPPLLEHIKPYLYAYAQRMQALLEQGIASGEIKACDTEESAFALISLLEGLIIVSLLYDALNRLPERLRLAITIFMDGLKSA